MFNNGSNLVTEMLRYVQFCIKNSYNDVITFC